MSAPASSRRCWRWPSTAASSPPRRGCRISQPALTRTLKRLETQLGVRLFERSTRRVQITAAGREFAAVAERMLNDLGITVQSVREVAQERRGLVVISCVMSVAGGRLPRMIAAYRGDRPGVEIHVREGVHAVDPRAMCAAASPISASAMSTSCPTSRSARRWAARPSMPSCRRATSLPAGAASAWPSSPTHPIVALPTESRTRRTIDAAAVTAGLQLRQRVVVNQIATLLALVGAGVGVGVVPRGATRGPLGRGLRFIPLAEPKLVRRLGLIALREREPTPVGGGLHGPAAPSMAANPIDA